MMENKLLKLWGFLVNPASRQAPQTKITKKIGNGIINTDTKNSINNQLRLSLFVLVYKYSHFKRCI